MATASTREGLEAGAPELRGLASGTDETWADARAEGLGSREDEGLEPGTALGRYVILEQVGSGGMGVVYAAFDPQLDRRVAVKVLHERREPGGASKATARLLREAQALAKLDDPHVVAVHDVGEVDGQIYLAMEFIDGPTLGQWLEQRERSLDEILAVALAAGRGLAAAHRAGLVHRDFKPDNVMLDGRERPRVMDFGLARQTDRALARAFDTSESSTPSLSGERALELDLTQTGAAIGTPAYMAPEQHLGLPTDARCDQFAFCVTLYEALYGQRPYAGETYGELMIAVTEGELREAPRGARRIPRWIEAILRRGLSREPAARFPDMASLLAALADDPSSRRKRRVSLGLGALLIASSAALVTSIATRSGPEAPSCAEVDAPIHAIWSSAEAESLRASFLASGRSYGEQTAERAIEAIEAHALAWTRTARGGCEAHFIEARSSAELYARQTLCLERPKVALAELLERLTQADARVVDEALHAIDSLPNPEDCADLDNLLAGLAPPPAPIADAVAEGRRQLERARALRATGSADEARAVLEMESPVDFGPLAAEFALERGQVALDLGDYEDASASLERAYALAIEHEHGQVAASSATALVYVVGYRLAQHQAGFAWEVSARAWAGRVDPGGLLWAQVLHNSGVLYDAAGDSDAAEPVYREALAIRREVHGDEHPLVARSMHNLGNIYLDRGEYDEAATHYSQARDLYAATLGEGHPALTGPLNNLGLAHRRARRFEASAQALREANAILEATRGARHPVLALGLNNLAATLVNLGELDEAADLAARSFAIRHETLGPEHPDLADTRCVLAEIALARGQFAQAREQADASVLRYASSFGPEHPQLGIALDLRGRVRLAAGDPDGALDDLEGSRAIRERTSGPSELAATLDSLARAQLASGKPEAAQATKRAALSAYAQAGPNYANLAAELDAAIPSD